MHLLDPNAVAGTGAGNYPLERYFETALVAVIGIIDLRRIAADWRIAEAQHAQQRRVAVERGEVFFPGLAAGAGLSANSAE